MIKIPSWSWQEADKLKLRSCSRMGRAIEKQIQIVVRAGLKPGTSRFQVRSPFKPFDHAASAISS